VNRRKFNQLAGMAGLGALAGRKAVSAVISVATSATGSSQTGNHSAARGRGLGDGYLVGAAYYPEWWPSSEWEIDFREMHELGINAVRMGEFAWAQFEPAPGKFDFDWMDRALAIAGRNGIGAVMGTPTASIPPWLYQQYPDVLSGSAEGPYTYGGRKGYNTNSPHYLEACARVVTALADHYGKNPTVIGWQLDNEPGNPQQTFDAVSERAFEQWLKNRYGTLDELNRVYNGAFWSNKFTDWSQIRFPSNSAEGGWQPAISLDYRRFFSESFLNHLRKQAEILHARTENQFVLTNWSSPTGAVDAYAAAEFLDASAWDNYVSAPGLSRFQRQYTSGYLSDITRCAGPQQRFICAEQNAYVPPDADPEGLRLQAYCDLAHGSHGQLYFEWRRPAAGGEEHRPSFIKGFDGAINPDKDTLALICREMAHLGPKLANATTRANIALIYDYVNAWAEGTGSIGGDRIPRYGEIQSFYTGLKSLHCDIDIIPRDRDLSGYKIVVASNLRLIDDRTVDRLKAFVAAGGTLVLNYRVATQNMDNSMRLTLAPGPFTDIAGVKSEAILDLSEYNAQNGNLDANLLAGLGIQFVGSEKAFSPRTAIESLTLHGAEVIATVRGGGPMEGRPAVTRNRHGRGWVIYVGCDSSSDDFYEAVAHVAGAASGLTPLIEAPHGVEVTSRQDGDTTFYFLLNLTENPQDKITLPKPMDDLIHDRHGITEVTLGPLEVAVLAS
jgi:beta-galactosidase